VAPFAAGCPLEVPGKSQRDFPLWRKHFLLGAKPFSGISHRLSGFRRSLLETACAGGKLRTISFRQSSLAQVHGSARHRGVTCPGLNTRGSVVDHSSQRASNGPRLHGDPDFATSLRAGVWRRLCRNLRVRSDASAALCCSQDQFGSSNHLMRHTIVCAHLVSVILFFPLFQRGRK